MSYHKSHRKFGRVRKVRSALIKSLLLALITREKISTTEPKAKEIRPLIEKIITLGKKSDLHTFKLISTKVGSTKAAKKVIEKLSPKYKDRKGGYTRIIKLERRLRDASKMAIIEFI
ncbi:50S ribosomal protein L17 [Candidatus Nomurabacteria bacterium]|nr:50S ribosomal protein L17 [Candidatus Nomurabacteria bacterium]